VARDPETEQEGAERERRRLEIEREDEGVLRQQREPNDRVHRSPEEIHLGRTPLQRNAPEKKRAIKSMASPH